MKKNTNTEKRNILISGGAGFIRSNFIAFFSDKYTNYRIINLDLLTESASQTYEAEIKRKCDSYNFIYGDICDDKLVERIFYDYNIQGVIYFAAESHVDYSIINPEKFVRSNILGTFVLLNAAKKYWLNGSFQPKLEHQHCVFYHISTNEVYGTLQKNGYFTETSFYAPNSPYSATKASSDMLVRSYNRTLGLNTKISNCSNNYGPLQHDEKLIPTIIRKALKNEPIPIYGAGANIRAWLYVDDHCRAIDLIFHSGAIGESYVIGGGIEKTNLEVANVICDILDRQKPQPSFFYKQLITFVNDRPGHDFRYSIDFSKLSAELSWHPKENFESRIEKTVSWYIKKYL